MENLNCSGHMRTLVWAFGEAGVWGCILLHQSTPLLTSSITGCWSWSFFSFFFFFIPGKHLHLGCYRPEVACQPLGRMWLVQCIMAGCWHTTAKLETRNGAAWGCLPLNQSDKRCVFLWQVVATAGALLACALGLFCPGQLKSATGGEYSSSGKLLLSLQDIMTQQWWQQGFRPVLRWAGRCLGLPPGSVRPVGEDLSLRGTQCAPWGGGPRQKCPCKLALNQNCQSQVRNPGGRSGRCMPQVRGTVRNAVRAPLALAPALCWLICFPQGVWAPSHPSLLRLSLVPLCS